MALSKASIHWPKRRGPGDHDPYRIVAEEVTERMELCGMWCVQKGPASPYGTLGPHPAHDWCG